MKTSPIYLKLNHFLTSLFCLTVFSAFLAGNGDVYAQNFKMNPGQSLAEMRDEVRVWHQQNPGKTATVTIPAGTYFVSEAVEFTPADSGTIYQAENAEQKPIFTRGTEITGWKTLPNGWLTATIPCVKSGEAWFECLFINGKRATLARSPNPDVADGNRYFYVKDVNEMNPGTQFYTRAEEHTLVEEIAKMPNPEDVKIMFYHSWESSLHRVASVDATQNFVTLTGPPRWEINRWGASQRYHIEGLESALDQGGEFLLKRDGTCIYIPRKGETAENIHAVVAFDAGNKAKAENVPQFENSGFLKFTGNAEKVRDITFRDVIFSCDVWTLPKAGLSDGQSAVSSPASILANHAESLAFIGCEVRNVGGYAFHFHQACRACRVEKCLMEDLGAGGVRIGAGHGTDLSPANLTSEITVTNCIIRGYGRLDAGGIGVWIGHSPKNVVLHNDISDGFYTGVSVGWVWGYRPSVAVENKIEFNHIHNIGHGVLSDMGGVYSLGISPGTTVSNNVIHDVYSYNRYGRGGWGLYTDEGSSEIVMENNLVYRTHTGNFHQHYGKDNVLRNNIFAFSREEQMKRSRNEEHRSFTLERNIIVYDSSAGETLLFGHWKNPYSELNGNLYWNYAPENKVDFDGMTPEEWQAVGKDATIFIENPCFVDAKNNDFRFTKESETILKKMGFVPFDFTRAGILKDDAQWTEELKNWTYPTVILAPDAPVAPFELVDNFETQRIRPIRKVSSPFGKPDSYKILEENGNHFLRIVDTPDQPQDFSPFYSYSMKFAESGTVRIAFDARVSEKAMLMAEGRDNASPYRMSVPLRILAHEVKFLNQKICENEPNRWARYEISLPVGPEIAEGGKTFTLKITPAGGETQIFELPVANPNCVSLCEFVFAALGAVDAELDLDNIEIRSEEK